MSRVDADGGRPRVLVLRWGVLGVLALLVLVAHLEPCGPVSAPVAQSAAASVGEDDGGRGPCHADRTDPAVRGQARPLGSPLPQVTALPDYVAGGAYGRLTTVDALSRHRAATGTSGGDLLTALGVART